MEKYRRAEGKRGKTTLQNLKGKQEAETKALSMRVQLQVEERERDRTRDEQQLRQKYENILK